MTWRSAARILTAFIAVMMLAALATAAIFRITGS
jgi:hypothetical protein